MAQAGLRLLLELVEADRRFKHQQDVEALLPDVLHNAGYVFRFGDRLVDGFSQLLNEFSQLCVQGVSPFTPRHRTAWSALELFSTLLSDVPGEQPESARLLNFSVWSRICSAANSESAFASRLECCWTAQPKAALRSAAARCCRRQRSRPSLHTQVYAGRGKGCRQGIAQIRRGGVETICACGWRSLA